jgi:hypothetical protein
MFRSRSVPRSGDCAPERNITERGQLYAQGTDSLAPLLLSLFLAVFNVAAAQRTSDTHE